MVHPLRRSFPNMDLWRTFVGIHEQRYCRCRSEKQPCSPDCDIAQFQPLAKIASTFPEPGPPSQGMSFPHDERLCSGVCAGTFRDHWGPEPREGPINGMENNTLVSASITASAGQLCCCT